MSCYYLYAIRKFLQPPLTFARKVTKQYTWPTVLKRRNETTYTTIYTVYPLIKCRREVNNWNMHCLFPICFARNSSVCETFIMSEVDSSSQRRMFIETTVCKKHQYCTKPIFQLYNWKFLYIFVYYVYDAEPLNQYIGHHEGIHMDFHTAHEEHVRTRRSDTANAHSLRVTVNVLGREFKLLLRPDNMPVCVPKIW